MFLISLISVPSVCYFLHLILILSLQVASFFCLFILTVVLNFILSSHSQDVNYHFYSDNSNIHLSFQAFLCILGYSSQQIQPSSHLIPFLSIWILASFNVNKSEIQESHSGLLSHSTHQSYSNIFIFPLDYSQNFFFLSLFALPNLTS